MERNVDSPRRDRIFDIISFATAIYILDDPSFLKNCQFF